MTLSQAGALTSALLFHLQGDPIMTGFDGATFEFQGEVCFYSFRPCYGMANIMSDCSAAHACLLCFLALSTILFGSVHSHVCCYMRRSAASTTSCLSASTRCPCG